MGSWKSHFRPVDVQGEHDGNISSHFLCRILQSVSKHGTTSIGMSYSRQAFLARDSHFLRSFTT